MKKLLTLFFLALLLLPALANAGGPPFNSGGNFNGGAGFQAGGSPTGSAGGDLGGTYPNPTVASVAHVNTGTLPVANGGTGFSTGQATGLYGTFLTSGTTYQAYGDSITGNTGCTASQYCFADLIATDTAANFTNRGISGEMACDMNAAEVFATTPMSLTSETFMTMMIGINDASTKGAGTYEAVYENCHQSSLAWLTVPASYKVYASAGTMTGTWAADSSIISGIAEKSTTNGSTLSITIQTYGGPIYLWYLVEDSNGGTFTYALDGGSAVSVNAFTSPAIATLNSGTTAVNYVRIPGVASGSHTVVFTVTSATSASNVVSIYGAGTSPQLPYANQNTVLSMGVTEREANSVAAVANYNTDAYNDTALLMGDGLPIRWIPVQNIFAALCPGQTSACMSDTYHPNNTGHEYLREAVEAIAQFPKNNSFPTAVYGGGTYLNPNSSNSFGTSNSSPLDGGIAFWNASGAWAGADFGYDATFGYGLRLTGYGGNIFFASSGANPSTQGSFSTEFVIAGAGHFTGVKSSFGAPLIASNACGSTTQGTVSSNSTDGAGQFTVGTTTSGGVTSCAVGFRQNWWASHPYACTIQAASAAAAAVVGTAYVSSISASSGYSGEGGFTVTGVGLDSSSWYFHCF